MTHCKFQQWSNKEDLKNSTINYWRKDFLTGPRHGCQETTESESSGNLTTIRSSSHKYNGQNHKKHACNKPMFILLWMMTNWFLCTSDTFSPLFFIWLGTPVHLIKKSFTMQHDNDPKHTSKSIEKWMFQNHTKLS